MAITKKQLKEYFDGKFDVTFEDIVKKFELKEKEILKIEKFLEQLEKEGWIHKSYCSEHKTYEYDAGEEQGY